MDFSWLIIGGGIHGVLVANRLLQDGLTTPSELAIVDPNAQLLASWQRNTAATGMAHLRSPSMHHLDVDPYSLERFAHGGNGRFADEFCSPNDRPSLKLFHHHSEAVIRRTGLAARHLEDRAVRIEPNADHVEVEMELGGATRSRFVVLALGAGDRLRWPTWAPRHDCRVQHIFDSNYRAPAQASRVVAVVGGGITAAQAAVKLARQGVSVKLLTRHRPRIHQYDNDPGWFGPKYMLEYEQTQSLSARRATITRARHSGSRPPDVQAALEHEQALGSVTIWLGEVREFDATSERIRLSLDGERIETVDKVVLATGYAPERPGGAMVDRLVESAGLSVAPCGYPVVDRFLRWSSRLFVTGALAELELGPIARNIAGGRRAADRVAGCMHQEDAAPARATRRLRGQSHPSMALRTCLSLGSTLAVER